MSSVAEYENGNGHLPSPRFEIPPVESVGIEILEESQALANTLKPKELGTDQLKSLANKHYHESVHLIRRSMLVHARFTGMALIEIKERVGHNNWTDWLDENFDGSPEAARLAMRIAKYWAKLLEKGFDQIRTPEDARKFIADSEATEKAAKKENSSTTKQSRKKKDAPKPQEAEEPVSFAPPFTLTSEDAKEFDDLVYWLQENWKPEIKSVAQIVMEALRFVKGVHSDE